MSANACLDKFRYIDYGRYVNWQYPWGSAFYILLLALRAELDVPHRMRQILFNRWSRAVR